MCCAAVLHDCAQDPIPNQCVFCANPFQEFSYTSEHYYFCVMPFACEDDDNTPVDACLVCGELLFTRNISYCTLCADWVVYELEIDFATEPPDRLCNDPDCIYCDYITHNCTAWIGQGCCTTCGWYDNSPCVRSAEYYYYMHMTNEDDDIPDPNSQCIICGEYLYGDSTAEYCADCAPLYFHTEKRRKT